MEKLNPEKLTVEYRTGVSETDPVIGRKYTLTHSDTTAELFLTIGLDFAYDQVTKMRDEVLAEWWTDKGVPFLYGTVSVDGEMSSVFTSIRDTIFRKELPLALEAIIYGDRALIEKHPELENAEIWIYFDSVSPKYNKYEYWGKVRDYQ